MRLFSSERARIFFVVAGLGLSVFLAQWLFDREKRSNISAVEGTEAVALATQHALKVAQQVEDSSRYARSEGIGVLLQGIVVGPNGEPVESVVVSWRRLPEPDYNYRTSWSSIEAMQSQYTTVTTTSGSSGLFCFVDAPKDLTSSDSVLWATHPQYVAAALQVKTLDLTTGTVHRIRFENRSSTRVLVVDLSGAPVAARLHHRGIRPDPRESPDTFGCRAYHVFGRDLDCDAEGTVFSPLPGRQAIWAELSGQESDVWIGTGEDLRDIELVRLVVGSGLELAGWVRSELGRPLPPYLEVGVFEVVGASSRLLKRSFVREDASWGPARVPFASENAYFVELSGEGVVTYQAEIPPQSVPGSVDVPLVARRASSLEIHVRELNGLALHDAHVRASWSLSDQAGLDQARTNDQGIAKLSGCPATTVRLDVEKSGYVMPRTEYIALSEGAANSVLVEMQRAGVIRGTCLHDGMPVKDFDVVTWHGNPGATHKIESFSDRADGRFEIVGAPFGRVSIFAASENNPRSVVQVVNVHEDGPAEVLIELPDPVIGKGQIVDLDSGDPIAGARIQLYTSYQACYFSAWGQSVESDSSGRFSVVGFAPGDSRYSVRADGYVQYLGQAFAVPGSEIDLGVIPLSRAQTLTIVLKAEPGAKEVDFTQYFVRATGNQHYPEIPFSNQGIARYEGAGPGLYFVLVHGPLESRSIEEFMYPGDDWTVVFPIGVRKRLKVRVIGADGRSANEHGVTRVDAVYVASHGVEVREMLAMSSDGEAVFNDLGCDRAVIEAVDSNGKRVGVAMASIIEQENSTDLVVGASGVRVRVTSPDNVPIEGATVALYSGGSDIQWTTRGSTDSAGEYSYPSLAIRHLFLNVTHPIHGSLAGVPVVVDDHDDDPVLVVLDADAKVLVRLMDKDRPLPGIQTRVYAETCDFEIGDYPSNTSGVIASGAVAEGRYRVVVRQPGVWGSEHVVPATTDDVPVDVQVRRLGDLELRVRTKNGQPVVGGKVELVSEESGVDVAEWIAAGRLHLPTGGLVTDANGELTVVGLPNGAYRVTVFHADFGSITAEATVPPRAAATTHVVVE